MVAFSLATFFTLFLLALIISVFTKIKIPFIDYPAVALLSRYYIIQKRRKNNFIHHNWIPVYANVDNQDFRWEHNIGDELVAKLRIKYYISKRIYVAYHYRFISSDVIDETTMIGEPRYLLRMFNIPRRSYTVVNPTGRSKYKHLLGHMDHPIIVTTKFKSL